MLAQIAVAPSVLRSWQKLLDNIKTFGVRKLVSTHSRSASDADLSEASLETISDENDKEPWLIPEIRESFKAVMREQWVELMNGMDPLTRMGAIVEDDDADLADDWPFDSNPLTEWAYTKGNDAVVLGAKKRGKTNLALLLAEYFLAEGWVVVCNIHVKNAPKGLYYTATLSAMLKQICKARLEKLKVLIITDEGAIFWAKITTISRQSQALTKIFLTLGKLDANLVYVTHYEKDVPSVIALASVATFEKISLKNVYIEIKDGLKIRPKLFTSVPATKLEYDPGQIENFRVDIDVDKLFAYMSDLPEDSNQWEGMLKYIEQAPQTSANGISDEEIAKTLRERKKASIGEIADIMGKSKSVIHAWVSNNKVEDF